MRAPEHVEIGVATHTGRVRGANEDDYLVFAPQTAEECRQLGWWFAVADGMGGAAAGADASRTAVRAAVRAGLDGSDTEPDQRMADCFTAAVGAVFELSREEPRLRSTGTTLTIANLIDHRLVLGHVGDTRCLLLRNGDLGQLSTDHVVQGDGNQLTRCVGAGQREVEVDITEHRVREGDCLALVSDGLWGCVSPADLAELLSNNPPQAAATAAVRMANASGGRDNITAVIVRIHGVEPGAFREVELPRDEERDLPQIHRPATGLTVRRWPWVALLACGAVLLLAGIAKAFLGFDPVAWLVARLR